MSGSLCGVLPHGDGIMIVQLHATHGKSWKPVVGFIHVYLTDSGRYLMPVGKFGKADHAEQTRLRHVVKSYFHQVLKASVAGRDA
eukprot:275546-Karenia_brevis.AAC.1